MFFSAPYHDAHVVDLCLSVSGFVYGFLNQLPEHVALLLTKLVNELTAKAVCVDMVLVLNRHFVISKIVSFSKPVNELWGYQAVETHFGQCDILFDFFVRQSLYLWKPLIDEFWILVI